MGEISELVRTYGCDMEIPFPIEEYQQRVTNVKQVMAQQGIDLLYCTAPETLFYLVGYHSSWYQAQSPKGRQRLAGVAVTANEKTPILLDRTVEDILVHNTCVGCDIRIYRQEPGISQLEFIVKNLKDAGWLKGKVALEKWNYLPSPAASQMLQCAFEEEGCEVVDGTDIVRELRTVKSPLEMGYVRTAAKIADIGMKAAIEHIRPGMTELDVKAEMDYACAKAGGEVAGLPTFVHTGRRSAQLHALTARCKIMPGDIVTLDLCGVYNRYHADVARTVSMGEPDPDVAGWIELSANAFPVLMKVMKPNCRISKINSAVEQYYNEVGIWESRLFVGGYDLGIAFPPDWVGVFFYGPGIPEERMFVPGTVVNYESDFYLPKSAGQSAIMDTIVIDEKKAELLSQIPQKLIVVED